jgi:transcriptional regulator with XRE-family HTH domain
MSGSPTLGRRRLGLTLRVLRQAAALTGEEAGQRVERSGSWISRVEMGRIGLRPPELRDLLDVYGVDDAELSERLAELARTGKQRGWWSGYADTVPPQYATYIGLEQGAAEIHDCESVMVDGLLQTADYARAVLRSMRPQKSDEDIARRVEVRLERQEVLRRSEPALYWGIVDESILHRVIGGPDVMRGQLKQLVEVAELPNVTIQVMPYAGGGEVRMDNPFTLLRFDDDGDEDVVYIETLTGALFPERADIKRYSLLLEHLRAAAASPLASVRMIEKAWRMYE